jgi:hypothetical protein
MTFFGKDQQRSIPKDDLRLMAIEVLCRWGDKSGTMAAQAVAKLSKLIDMMATRKDGTCKDPHATLHFMRRCAAARDEVLIMQGTATEHASAKRVELDEDAVSWCYQKFGRDLLEHDLLPHQQINTRYCLRTRFEGDTYLNNYQRSFTDNMLRKNLGSKQVAFHIWQHGLPSITDGCYSKEVDTCMLQSSMEEGLHWYAALATSIVTHESQSGFHTQQSLGSIHPDEQQERRRETLQRAREALRKGKALVEERDRKKRKYDDMRCSEQRALEDYETGKAQRSVDVHTVKPLKTFRSTL